MEATAKKTTGVFGSETRTAILVAIHLLNETHARELASMLGRSVSRVQAAVDSLESAGLVVGSLEGSTRRLRLNPRFFALAELESLLQRMGTVDAKLQQKLATERRRPRKSGKAL